MENEREQIYKEGYSDGWKDCQIHMEDERDGHWIALDDAIPKYGQRIWLSDGEYRIIAYRDNDGVNDTWVPIQFCDGQTYLRGPAKYWRELKLPESPKDWLQRIFKKGIEEFGKRQAEKHYRCPRCGQNTMSDTPERNALSRNAEVYICDKCGMEEALESIDYAEQRQFKDWYIVQHFELFK